MNDNSNQDRSQTEGQSGIDRETEARNRENETGQTQDQQFGQDKGQPATDQDSNTTLSERTGQIGDETPTGEAGSEGFVGSGKDDSSDYLTKGEENQDFAARGEGAQDTDAGRSDIETGQPSDESEIDEG